MPTPTIDLSSYGQFVTFSVYPTGVIQTEFVNAQILSVLDWESAKNIIDIYGMHAMVYPAVLAGNPGTPNDPKKYSYLKVKLQGGQITAVGLPWIDMSSYVVNDYVQVQFTVSDITTADIALIKEILSANNFNSVAYTPL